jgi:hypothetical protein
VLTLKLILLVLQRDDEPLGLLGLLLCHGAVSVAVLLRGKQFILTMSKDRVQLVQI